MAALGLKTLQFNTRPLNQGRPRRAAPTVRSELLTEAVDLVLAGHTLDAQSTSLVRYFMGLQQDGRRLA